MKRLEIFPDEEHKQMIQDLLSGDGQEKSFPTLIDEKIYRLKQLILKYTGSETIKEYLMDNFKMSCPLCESFINDPKSYNSCMGCPWREQYIDMEYACETWTNNYYSASACYIETIKEAKKARITDIYKWIKHYQGELNNVNRN